MSTIPLYKVRKIANLKELLHQSCELFGLNKAFILKNKDTQEHIEISYMQFYQEVNSLGTALLSLGLKDKRIGILAENRYEWALSYFSVVNGTGIVVPIDKGLPDNEIENIIERSELDAIMFSEKFQTLMSDISKKHKEIQHFISMDLTKHADKFLSMPQLLDTGRNLINNGDRHFIDSEIDNEKMSILLFTSGTTSLAKAVMLSHKNICSNIMDVCSVFNVYQDDVFLSFLPLHHMYECTCGFLAVLYSGASIAYCEGLKHIAKNLKEYRTTVMCSVPLIYENMYKRVWNQISKKRSTFILTKIILALSNFLRRAFRINLTKTFFKKIHNTLGGRIRVFLSGAAAIDPTVSKGFRDFGIHLLQGYGLSECSPLVTANDDKRFKDSAAGLPLPNLEIRLDDVVNGIGEIVTKGPNVMLGYYNDEESTSRVLKDGWFYTGDLGYFDKSGFLHITGRKKNVIVLKNGKNIFPEELETLLNRSPYIKESMVYGKPDQHGDNIICTAVVVDTEAVEETNPCIASNFEQVKAMIEQAVKAINKKLPSYKHIREITVRKQDFIKTTTQKVKRYMEQKSYAQKFN